MMLYSQSGSGSGSGLGLAPGNQCYDPNRPAWLPYWWDTVGESHCLESKVQSIPSGLNMPPAPTAPQTAEQMATWTPDEVFLRQRYQYEQWKSANQLSIPLDQYGAPPEPPAPTPDWWDKNKWFVAAAGIGYFAVASMLNR